MATTRMIQKRKKRIGKWSELDLINEIQKNTVLYDKTLKDYRKPGPTELAWKNIAEALGANTEDLKKRWKSLRDTFIKYYRMEIEQSSPLNTRQRVWKYYNNLNYLRNHVELYRLDEASDRGASIKSISNDDQYQYEYESTSNQQTTSRHEYTSPGTKPKTNTIKVLVEAGGNDPYKTAEYTFYETNNDGESTEMDQGNSDQIYVEPIESEEYHIGSESLEPAPKKDPPKQLEILSQFSNDPDEKFLMSCLPVLKRVTPQKNALLKLKIQMLLYEIEFGSAEDS